MNKKTLLEYKCTRQILRDLNKTLLNARNICTQCHVNSWARTEAFWVFSPGFSCLINNISNIKQSNFDLHFLKIEYCLYFKSDFDRPWSSKCLPIAEYLFQLQNVKGKKKIFSQCTRKKRAMTNRNWENEVGRGRALTSGKISAKSAVSIMHEHNISYGKIHLHDTTHERTIIFRQLFSGHMLGSRIKKRNTRKELVMLLNERK